MTNIARLPLKPGRTFGLASLAADERRVRDWFDSLGGPDRLKSYSLAEIRAAVSIPTTRLRVVLFRLGWIALRQTGFGVLTYYKRHRSLWPSDIVDADHIIRKLREQS
jgi:hypothetical protein